MFIQSTTGNLRIKIDTSSINNQNILEGASIVVKLKRRDHRVEKEAVIVNLEEQIAMCYLKPEDLILSGNYDYQVIVTTKERHIIKSGLGSFYVSPSLMR